MSHDRGRAWSAGALLIAGCAVAVLVGLRLAAGPWHMATHLLAHHRSGQGPSFDDLVTTVCTGALVTALLWLAASTALVTLAQLVRSVGPVSDRLGAVAERVDRAGPIVIRRLVGAVLGLAVSAAAGTPAYADAGLPNRPAHQVGHELRHSLDGLALPGRVTDAPTRVASARPRAHPVTVVVAPGDSLWSISARLLGPGASGQATDGEITAAWHRLHRANRGRLSADPDLIVPGTALIVPDLHPTAPSREVPPT